MTISDLIKLFSGLSRKPITDGMMRNLIYTLKNNTVLLRISSDSELEFYVDGEWQTLSPELVEAIVARALPQEITTAANVNKYMSPFALKSVSVSCYAGQLTSYPEYIFPTGVIYDDKILDDDKIIER